jgi:DNA-binding NtrC family response regulator
MSACRVLLVEDEVDFVRTVTQELKRNKLSVEAVRSGNGALRHFAENPTDGTVLDVKMPGMAGIQALRKIEARQPLVEMIMLTGLGGVARRSTEIAP